MQHQSTTCADSMNDSMIGSSKTSTLLNSAQAALLYATISHQAFPTGYLLRNEHNKTLAQAITVNGGLLLDVQQGKMTALFAQHNLHNPAYQAVSTALVLIDQIATVNEVRQASGNPRLRLGIGISTGHVNFQSEEIGLKLTENSAGPLLEAARHLSKLNQQAPFPAAFINHETYAALIVGHEWHIENLGSVWLPEQKEAQIVHAVMRPICLQ